MTPEFLAGWFCLSFVTYSMLRSFDVESTRKLASQLDLQKYEVNPSLTWLAGRWSLDTSFRITWIVVGLGVATVDVILEHSLPFILPIAALIVGFGHILAAAHNTRLSFILKKVGKDQFEREHEESMTELREMSWKAKVSYLFRSNPTTFILSILALPLVVVLGVSMTFMSFFIVQDTSFKLLVVPFTLAFTFVIAMFIIYPAFLLGPLLLARRFPRKNGTDSQVESEPNVVKVELPVRLVEQALEIAKKEGASTVKISVTSLNGGD